MGKWGKKIYQMQPVWTSGVIHVPHFGKRRLSWRDFLTKPRLYRAFYKQLLNLGLLPWIHWSGLWTTETLAYVGFRVTCLINNKQVFIHDKTPQNLVA